MNENVYVVILQYFVMIIMVEETKKKGFQAVSLPKEFLIKIREHVDKSLDYRSVAEYVKDACKEKMIKQDHNISINLEKSPALDKFIDFIIKKYLEETGEAVTDDVKNGFGITFGDSKIENEGRELAKKYESAPEEIKEKISKDMTFEFNKIMKKHGL